MPDPLVPGDLNGNGCVDAADLAIILNNWNRPIPPGDPRADATGDVIVNAFDLAIVLTQWGQCLA